MSIFSKLRDFLHRHRNKFVVGGIIVTGTVFLTRYAQQRLKEWQDQEAKDILERTRKRQHFESTERTCDNTIISLSRALKESVLRILDAESLIAELKTNPENKIEIWEKLKMTVFTRACTIVYLQVMLVVTLRIQLNILGGYLYKDSAAISSEMQEKYLHLCNTLLDAGVEKLSRIIENELKKIIGSIELTKQLKINDLETIFSALQSNVTSNEQNPINNFKDYVISDDTPNGSELFNSMIGDTVDLLESDEVKTITVHCLYRGFIALSDSISEYYMPAERIQEIPDGTEFIHPADVKIPMAKLIPIVNGLIAKKTLPDHLTEQILLNTKVKTLGANIYECFSAK